jgi:nitroimidazol reductase NimA-like FMN-containing flavoprotein (pyridoxamine 5'-phosphate oxidase superfamily)
MRKNVTREESVINDILDRADVLHLALCDEDGPFCVPVNFARSGRTLFVHSGLKGRKAAALKNGRLGFSAVTDMEPKTSDQACKWGYRFKSVRGEAVSRILLDESERAAGLDIVVRRYAGESLPMNEDMLKATAVFALEMVEVTARIKD